MISTIEKDINFVDGKVTFSMKEYPNWYGIEGIGFIYHGPWLTSEIEYKGYRINSCTVEDTMWERFTREHEKFDKNINSCDDTFDAYMKDNAEDVYQLIELAMKDNEE